MKEDIRNFVIISHIDHGKSTLADRFLEITETISLKEMKPQFLDSMDIERERGITIKMQPVRMKYKDVVLNLIDTPGHVDFSYEVSRALAAVEGAILLVDASKGIQAQTIANLELAKEQGLVIIPAVNKIDLPQAKEEETVCELAELLNIKEEEIIRISAKNSINIEKVLNEVIKKIPPPKNYEKTKESKALIFDSDYDPYKGVIAYVRVINGEFFSGEKINLFATNMDAEIKEIGYFSPTQKPQKKLFEGEVGYIATGIKEPGKVRVGDTIYKGEGKPLPGYKDPRPMVFASLYPENADDFNILKDSIQKLKLSDPALIFEIESKEALGRGFRCGFLGTLHIEIVSERLKREFGLNLVISTPSVVYKVDLKQKKEILAYSPSDWPDQSEIEKTFEPWVLLEVVFPSAYYGAVTETLKDVRGKYIDTKYIGTEKIIFIYETPLSEIITNFYDKIKSATKGYASINYKIIGFKEGNLVKMEVLIAGNKEEAFSKIVPEERSFEEGKSLVKKLKNFLPSQQFIVALQAVIGGKVIARETISAKRKDVTGYLYGGDVSRKKKLLEKQKKGKKLLKEKGRVKIPSKVFLDVYRS